MLSFYERGNRCSLLTALAVCQAYKESGNVSRRKGRRLPPPSVTIVD